MKVLLLSDTYSEHTEKWALGLAGRGIEIGIFSFNKASYPWYEKKQNITLLFEPEKSIDAENFFTKVCYLKYIPALKRAIRFFKPDLLHAHYASSYGLVGALSGFHPFVLSVWGSDVYDFPNGSALQKKLLIYNLKKADRIMSTSRIMKEETAKYTGKPVVVTPFGVNTSVFSPAEISNKKKDVIYIGTIKPIEEKYGIIHIIEAAKILVNRHKNKHFKFMLIGPGHNLEHYQQLIDTAGLKINFEITGRVPFEKISEYHNLLDIFLNVSVDDSESFGVAAVEAMACEKPVIVTDVGGLKEVVGNGEFGLVIPRKDSGALAAAIEQVIGDPGRFTAFGKKARQHVIANYDWENNLDLMVREYQQLIHNPQKA